MNCGLWENSFTSFIALCYSPSKKLQVHLLPNTPLCSLLTFSCTFDNELPATRGEYLFTWPLRDLFFFFRILLGYMPKRELQGHRNRYVTDHIMPKLSPEFWYLYALSTIVHVGSYIATSLPSPGFIYCHFTQCHWHIIVVFTGISLLINAFSLHDSI
jgi:hypothetical protein